MMRQVRLLSILSIAILSSSWTARAADWPTWRYDSSRSAATDEQLPTTLHLNWTRQYLPLTPAWSEDPRLQFDASYEPVVMGKTMFVASSRNDSVTAINTNTGEERWRFHTDGPVRFAPIAKDGRLYFGADDGCFYCLNAVSGAQMWKFQAAPTNRKVIGNDRLISVWPMRGGPVLADGKIKFTVGVWPFEGTFLYTLDVATGQLITTEQAASGLVRTPNSKMETLKDLTPQGYLVATDSKLYIPCGRAVAACQDRKTGKFIKHSYGTRGTTSYHVTATDRFLFHGKVAFDAQSKTTLGISPSPPSIANDTAYFGQSGSIVAYDLANPKMVESKDRRGKVVKKLTLTKLWSVPNSQINDVPKDAEEFKKWIAENPLQIDVKAGNRLYGHQSKLVFAIDLPAGDSKPKVSWKATIDATPSSMLVADGKLFVVTKQGKIHCFSDSKNEPRHFPLPDPSYGKRTASKTDGTIAPLVKKLGIRDGYCIALGQSDKADDLLKAVVDGTQLKVTVVDRKPFERNAFENMGLYGQDVNSFISNPLDAGLPPYMANLVTVADLQSIGVSADNSLDTLAHVVFRSLRPYGGTAVLGLSQNEHQTFQEIVAKSKLPNAKIDRIGEFTTLTRVGALPGSADWTHEYGDASNTLMSQDQLVKAPLGVLWFGGPSSDGSLFYNRHYWGPSMAVVDGRMFIQGPGKLSAVDVYTGRILWQVNLKDDENYRPGRRGNDFEKVLAGFHFLVVPDGLYIVHEKSCLRIDPATGERLSEFKLPRKDDDWGRIRVQDDLLITEVFRDIPKLGKLAVELAALNRHNGEIVWNYKADFSFPIITVGKDRIFCFDGALESFYKDWKRKGLLPKSGDIRYLKAIDIKTGKEIWKYTTDVIVTWINFSQNHDVVMASNKKMMAAFRGKDGQEMWKNYSEGRGFKGHPESYWDRVIIRGDQVIDQRGPGAAYNLKTGKPVMRKHPLTGKLVPWEFTKSGHHCNYAIASPHLLTFRAASAGFCNVDSGTTARLDGFRSGCRNSLIPANGILNAPNFAHGCSCGYSIFTSLAFTHLPEAEMWSYSPIKLKPKEDQVVRVGINFGAPGDRLASNGTLWLDYPSVGGSSPSIPIKIQADQPRYFRKHSSFLDGGNKRWVAASGVEGITSVNVGLNGPGDQSKKYSISLHFSEPDDVKPGERVFDVAIQGKTVAKDVDIASLSGGSNRTLVRTFSATVNSDNLQVQLTARNGRPLLCGIEIIAAEE